MSEPYLTLGGFKTLTGTELTYGTFTLQLSAPAVDTATGQTQICPGQVCNYNLDIAGNVAGTLQLVWPNDKITPSGTYYILTVYTAQGQLAWGPNAVTLNQGSGTYISLSNLVPGNPV